MLVVHLKTLLKLFRFVHKVMKNLATAFHLLLLLLLLLLMANFVLHEYSEGVQSRFIGGYCCLCIYIEKLGTP